MGVVGVGKCSNSPGSMLLLLWVVVVVVAVATEGVTRVECCCYSNFGHNNLGNNIDYLVVGGGGCGCGCGGGCHSEGCGYGCGWGRSGGWL